MYFIIYIFILANAETKIMEVEARHFQRAMYDHTECNEFAKHQQKEINAVLAVRNDSAIKAVIVQCNRK